MEILKIIEILLRRKWIIAITFFVFFFVVATVTRLVNPSWESTAALLVESSESLDSLTSTLGLQNMGGGFSSSDDYETDIALTTIRPLLNKVIDKLDLKGRDGKRLKSEDLVRSNFKKKLFPEPFIEVDQYGDADMLEIEAHAPSPELSAELANSVAEYYIQDTLDRTREEYKAARLFIEQQIDKVQEDYYRSLAAIKEFQIREGTVDLTLETQNLINKISTLKGNYEENEKAIVEFTRELMESELKLAQMEQFRKESEEFGQNEQVLSLKNRLNDLLIGIAEKSVDYTREHPDYKQVLVEVDAINKLLKNEADMVFNKERFSVDPAYDELSKSLVTNYINKEVALAKRKLLQQFIDTYKAELMSIPVKSSETSKLELALQVNSDTYKNLLEYLTQVGIAESMTLSSIRLVEPAITPERVDFPKRGLNYMVGFVFGLFWGIALAFFVEYIDNTLKTPDDLKLLEGMTLLGSIPQSKELKEAQIIHGMDPTLPIIESYRTVRNSIKYASLDKPMKTIAVTSSIENEGKSSMASNLAISLCGEGKVVLVDLDLRRPSLAKFFGLSNHSGVTNVLVEDHKLEDCIIETNIPNLYILPSGPVPPDPSSLIESNKLKEMIATLEEKYTHVVLDTPPVIAVNDAIVIGTNVDGLILVVEAGRATFTMVSHIKEQIDKAGINLVGVILNKLKIHGTSYHRYYYYNRYYK